MATTSYSVLILLDLSVAFDTFDQPLLLKNRTPLASKTLFIIGSPIYPTATSVSPKSPTLLFLYAWLSSKALSSNPLYSLSTPPCSVDDLAWLITTNHHMQTTPKSISAHPFYVLTHH